MNATFDKYPLGDATITKLCVEGAEAHVTIRTWQDATDILIFDDVAGVESMSFINAPLSHGLELENDEFLQRCCFLGGEAAVEYRCFGFYSVRHETPILKIVARSFAVFSIGSSVDTRLI